jgi:hypothetical protein
VDRQHLRSNNVWRLRRSEESKSVTLTRLFLGSARDYWGWGPLQTCRPPKPRSRGLRERASAAKRALGLDMAKVDPKDPRSPMGTRAAIVGPSTTQMQFINTVSGREDEDEDPVGEAVMK